MRIELPRFLDTTGGRTDAVAVFGWVWELWGCRLDDAWLEEHFSAYNHSPAQSVPLLIPDGWGLEKNTEEFNRYGSRSYVDYWLVDDRKRRRLEVRAYRDRGADEYMIRLYPRFSIFSDGFHRLPDGAAPVVLVQVLEGDTAVIKQVVYDQPSFSEDDYPDYRVRDRLVEGERGRLIHEATLEFKIALNREFPHWNDLVTSWFEPGTDPFRTDYKEYLRTSGLLLRWIKLFGSTRASDVLQRAQHPLHEVPLFERVEAQRIRLLGA